MSAGKKAIKKSESADSRKSEAEDIQRLRRERIVLDSDKWDEFVALLDRDIEADEKLVELFNSKPIWED